MGYPMSYKRVVSRNHLVGNYDPIAGGDCLQFDPRPMIAGDLRRLESDQRDERHLNEYARRTGLRPTDVKAVLDAFFEGDF